MWPYVLDLNDSSYFAPVSKQKVYHTMQALQYEFTVLNRDMLAYRLSDYEWSLTSSSSSISAETLSDIQNCIKISLLTDTQILTPYISTFRVKIESDQHNQTCSILEASEAVNIEIAVTF